MNERELVKGTVLSIPYEREEGKTDNEVKFLVLSVEPGQVGMSGAFSLVRIVMLDQCRQWVGIHDTTVTAIEGASENSWIVRGLVGFYVRADVLAGVASKNGAIYKKHLRAVLTVVDALPREAQLHADGEQDDDQAHYEDHIDALTNIINSLDI